ncbi:MAG: alpha/beta fold hydrolase [bacterium]|nr:alpha/beta fold hydrolase [bacterium]
MVKFPVIVSGLGVILLVSIAIFRAQSTNSDKTSLSNKPHEAALRAVAQLHPLSIESARKQEYPGSEFTIEQTLTPGSNYNKYVTSYLSEGLKIYGQLTIPKTTKPDNGYPVVVFNHGYIEPSEYRTIEKYVAYQDAFARAGYITFKSDYRGHGSSEGQAQGGYGNSGYTTDVLNATATLKKHPDADANKIGMWGHSMGGYITLRAMVIDPDIKAGVIWAGVVGSYPDLVNNWRRRSNQPQPSPSGARRWRQQLIEEYGEPEANAAFWNSISANNYLTDLAGPIQIHHGTADASVPVEFSQKLNTDLEKLNAATEYYEYAGDDHNLTRNLSIALNRSVQFFNTHIKNQ